MQTWICGFGSQRVVYLSGAITGGARLLGRVRAGDPYGREELIAENCADIVSGADRLRRAHHAVVVEPASLNVPGWSQDDYLNLWKTFIARHVSCVVFMPGWQFSAGCAAEFAHATACGIATETFDGKPLSVDAALTLLEEASQEVGALRGAVEIDRLLAGIGDAIMRIKSLGKQKAT